MLRGTIVLAGLCLRAQGAKRKNLCKSVLSRVFTADKLALSALMCCGCDVNIQRKKVGDESVAELLFQRSKRRPSINTRGPEDNTLVLAVMWQWLSRSSRSAAYLRFCPCFLLTSVGGTVCRSDDEDRRHFHLLFSG